MLTGRRDISGSGGSKSATGMEVRSVQPMGEPMKSKPPERKRSLMNPTWHRILGSRWSAGMEKLDLPRSPKTEGHRYAISTSSII
jgi:hypothetical protein